MPNIIVWTKLNSDGQYHMPDDNKFNIQIPCEGVLAAYNTESQLELNIRAALGSSAQANYNNAHVYILSVDQSIIDRINLERKNQVASKSKSLDGSTSFNFEMQLQPHQFKVLSGYKLAANEHNIPSCTTFGINTSTEAIKRVLASYFGKSINDVIISRDNIALPAKPARASGSALIWLGIFLSITIIGLIVGIPLIYEGIKRNNNDRDFSLKPGSSIKLTSQIEHNPRGHGKSVKDYVSEVTLCAQALDALNNEARQKGKSLAEVKSYLQAAIDKGNNIIKIVERVSALIEEGHTEFQEQLDQLKPLAVTANSTVKGLIGYSRTVQETDRDRVRMLREQQKAQQQRLAAEAALRARDVQVAALLSPAPVTTATPIVSAKRVEPNLAYFQDQGRVLFEKRTCHALLKQLKQVSTMPPEEGLTFLKESFQRAMKAGQEQCEKLSLALAQDPNHSELDAEFLEREQAAFKEYQKNWDIELQRIEALPKPVQKASPIEPGSKKTGNEVRASAIPLPRKSVKSSLFAKAPAFINEEMRYDVEIEASRYGDDHLLIKPSFVANRRQKLDRPQHSTILMADVSGSMRDAQSQLRETIRRLAVEQLPVGDSITLIAFGVNGSMIMKSAVIGSVNFDQDLEKAMIQLNCNQSGTNISSAFEQLTSESLIQGRTRIVLLTDGQDNSGRNPTHQTLIKLVEDKLGAVVPVDTIGMTTSINQPLLSDLSKSTQGAELFVKDQQDIDMALQNLGVYLGGDKTTEGSVTLSKNGVELQTIKFPQIPMGKSSSQVFDCPFETGEYTLSYQFGEVSFEKKIKVDKAIQHNPRVIARQIEAEFAKLIAPGVVIKSEEMNQALDDLLLKIQNLALTCDELEQVKSLIEVYKTAYNAHDFGTTMSYSSYTSTVTSMGGKYLGNDPLHSNPGATANLTLH